MDARKSRFTIPGGIRQEMLRTHDSGGTEAGVGTLTASARREDGEPTMELECLDHVGLTVADVGRSIRWYQAVLGGRGLAFEERDYGAAWSTYLPDPDGHLVEITAYEVPTGTGHGGS